MKKEQEAKPEMARRYFTHMGPSSIHDAMYYFHATAAQVKDCLLLSQENMRAIFNLAEIVMPALMIDGEVVGKWKKKNKKVERYYINPF